MATDKLSTLIGLVSNLLISSSHEEISLWIASNVTVPGGRKKQLVVFLMEKILNSSDMDETKLSVRLLGLIVSLVVHSGSDSEKEWVYLALSGTENFWESINALTTNSSSVSLKAHCLNLLMNAHALSPGSSWPMRIYTHLESAIFIAESDVSAGRRHMLVAYNYLLLAYSVSPASVIQRISVSPSFQCVCEISSQLLFPKYHVLFGATIDPALNKAFQQDALGC